ncbi:MAG: hypothetical protein IJ761_07880 [Bacteroidales bacterium]|nr:hypothetical protein [Bacteroidales bacterium]
MKHRLIVISLLLTLGAIGRSQDTVEWAEPPLPDTAQRLVTAPPDTVVLTLRDTVTLVRTDTVVRIVRDTVTRVRTDTVTVRVADTAALSALREKERFYREILSSNGVDKVKLEAERNHYIHVVDSLRSLVRIAEIENVRKDEANKYLAERARLAEEKVATSTNRKKKVRPIQGIAMRFYRTPAWEIRLNASSERHIANRNAGNVEFDYITGASVMLWDLSKYFNKDHQLQMTADRKTTEIRRFDQDFAYDLGLYVGFGGSNLFKNFYIGASFRFVDFFYFTAGFNIAEYQVLAEGYENGEILTAGQSIDDITSRAWLLKPFVALSIDLDFLSYIKK